MECRKWGKNRRINIEKKKKSGIMFAVDKGGKTDEKGLQNTIDISVIFPFR